MFELNINMKQTLIIWLVFGVANFKRSPYRVLMLIYRKPFEIAKRLTVDGSQFPAQSKKTKTKGN